MFYGISRGRYHGIKDMIHCVIMMTVITRCQTPQDMNATELAIFTSEKIDANKCLPSHFFKDHEHPVANNYRHHKQLIDPNTNRHNHPS